MISTINELNKKIILIEQYTNKLSDTLLSAGSQFDYWNENDTIKRGLNARKAAMQHLKIWWYINDDIISTRFGIIYTDHKCLELVHKINKIKMSFQKRHEEATAQVEPKDRPALLHKIKKNLMVSFNEPINLDAIDRKIPVFNYAAIRASWYQEASYSSTRRPIYDAIKEVEQKIDVANHTLSRNNLLSDLAVLEALPQDTYLCHRPKAKIKGQYCRLTLIEEHKRSHSQKCWGVNPIFVLNSNDIEAKIEWREPTNKTALNTNTQRKSAQGKSKTIQSYPVVKSLPYWFAYKKKQFKHKKLPLKTQNPHAKTAYPGIWIGVRRRNTNIEVSLRYLRKGERDSSVSLGSRSLSSAWSLAVARHINTFNDDSCAPKAHTLLALCPEQSQINKAVKWFEDKQNT